MKVKAKINFAGKVCMYIGEVREMSEATASSLIKCGYVEALSDNSAKTAKAVKKEDKNEGKRVKH